MTNAQKRELNNLRADLDRLGREHEAARLKAENLSVAIDIIDTLADTILDCDERQYARINNLAYAIRAMVKNVEPSRI